jgi:signal transduction histidine kinase
VWNEVKYKAEVVKEFGELPKVECLDGQINQVFMNLLVNAAQAIVERGTITLRAGQDADQVWLSLSYGIVKKHHGRIEVTSQVGKGSTFRVWLPVKQPISST